MEGWGWCTKGVLGPCGDSLWKSIRQETFSWFLQFDVDNGIRVKFWRDLWCDDCPLKLAFLELYGIWCDKVSSVAVVMQFSNEVTHWDVHFSRLVQPSKIGNWNP